MVKKGYKEAFRKVRKVFGFLGDIYFRVTDYPHLSELHAKQIEGGLELSGEVGKLSRRSVNLSGQYKKEVERTNRLSLKNKELTNTVTILSTKLNELEDSVNELAGQKNFLSKELAEAQNQLIKYQKGVLESPEYKELEEVKKQAEGKRDEYKKQIEDRDKLIGFLNADKSNLIKSANSLLREKAIGTLIEYFKKNFSKQPYIFIDPETAIIIDYTDEFSKELGIKEELKGQSYLTILDGKENVDKIRHIKKFFKVNEEKEFDVEYEKDGKKIPLHITKKPIISVDLPLNIKSMAKENIETIACVPLLVEKSSWLTKFHKHTLDEVMEKTEEETKLLEEVERETPKVHRKLIHYRWDSKKISKIMDKMDPTQSYLYFKKMLSSERRKDARLRLKKVKSEREKRKEKRDKIINNFYKVYKIKKEDMMKTWNESKNFKDFIYRCREISEPYRIKQKQQKETEKPT